MTMIACPAHFCGLVTHHLVPRAQNADRSFDRVSIWCVAIDLHACYLQVSAFCDKVCDGLQCTPKLNSTYTVQSMGCFNDTGSGPDFDGACGFVSVGSGCSGDKPCKGNRYNNSCVHYRSPVRFRFPFSFFLRLTDRWTTPWPCTVAHEQLGVRRADMQSCWLLDCSGG